ncbi:MAG: flagellar protein FliT [Gammaproteobacteria bacterium]|nr:flagellar protein FliT [Gammaproteobacteria bacterium]
MFFTEPRQHFFRPFNSKYREQVVECLRELYNRLYSSMADYSRAVSKENVLECFQDAITRAPLINDNEEDEGEPAGLAVRSERDQANWVLNVLLEHGWLERQVDEATLQSSYGFSRVGRLFTQPMVETVSGRFRTRHRNTRNTRNALQSFLARGEVYDLLDAYEYSERIISDFSDVIAELDERKRQLVREVEARQIIQHATDEFFEFMEKRFMPDLAVRLSADSVEKYRDEIHGLIRKVKRRKNTFKANAERELRKLAPELITEPSVSVLMRILDGIEARTHNASDVMLPALRRALHSFTRRADIIIRQLSFTHSGKRSQLLSICQSLKTMDADAQQQRLSAASRCLAQLNLGLVDPGALKLHMGRSARAVNTSAEESVTADATIRRALFVEQALQTAFIVNNNTLRAYIIEALAKGHRIHSQNLPVRNAKELLMSAHAIEVGAAGNVSSEFQFCIRPTGQTVQTEYFERLDEFTIEVVETKAHD